MKRLRKIKLINWHYYVNETIEIGGNTLVTGENGAGKSTVLDSIQFVLSPGKQKFNIAANDGTKRTLNAYVRGKLGKSTQKYLREGDVTCHISLEFYDTNTEKTFVIGAVIDSQDTISAPKTMFYDLDNCVIDDSLFLNKDNIPFNIKEFKANSKTVDSDAKFLTSQSQARKAIAYRFNITDYKFFDILPKALAFKPINNVKDFIYSYILDEKELDIKYLIGNIKTYKEFIEILENINEKIDRLEKINKVFTEIRSIEDKFKISLYVYKKCQYEATFHQIKNNQTMRETYEKNISTLNDEIRILKNTHNELISKRDELHVSLLVDDEYKLLSRLKQDKDSLIEKVKTLKDKDNKVNKYLEAEYKRAQQLKTLEFNDPSIDKFLTYETQVINESNLDKFIETVDAYYKFLSLEKEKINTSYIRESMNRSSIEKELYTLNNDIKTLSEKRVLIPNDVTNFKERLKQEFKIRHDLIVNPIILCEVLEVKDNTWQNAIEGYLGRHRFNILVNPDNFDKALLIYKDIRKDFKNFAISLVNTKELKKYSDENKDGLSSEVTSSYSYAKYYINYRLNNVIKVNDVTELEKHNVAVTKDCILYSGYTVSELNRRNYKTHFIGANAYLKQLEDCKKTLQEKSSLINELKTNIERLDYLKNTLSLDMLQVIKDCGPIKRELFQTNSSISDLEETIANINSGNVQDKQSIIRDIESDIEALTVKLKGFEKDLNVTTHKLTDLASVEELELKLKEQKDDIDEYEKEIILLLNEAKKEFEMIFDQDNISFTSLEKSTKTELERYEKSYNSQLNKLVVSQKYYNLTFNFEGEEGVSGMDRFYEEYQRLKNSQLVTYEEKVHESKSRSEVELKEHFVYRLHESLLEGHKHFDDLNASLRGILFGQDEYRFEIKPNPKYREFYDMLMDSVTHASKTSDGFSEEFNKKHGRTLDRLVNHIISDEVSEKILEEIVDYRTFMDYDIKIKHSDDSISLLSEISREKSGGETQIPYYVAMAATFIKIYNSNSEKSDSMGIVLFDEAFDKMDSTRTEAMMTFLTNLGMQVILSAPPQKVEDIFPYAESTIIVTKEDQYSWTYSLTKEEMIVNNKA